MQEKLKFSVDSALLRELGEKLVETVHVALVELVKNSYDADATKVEIIFNKDKHNRSQIQVIDDGKGMNFEAIDNYWMRIATNNKEDRDTSKLYGRPLTGAKGIGRFSCRRLGAHLKLITQGSEDGYHTGNQEDIQRTEVEFPWNEFEPGTEVTEIECNGDKSVLNNGETGTTLIISKLSEEWNSRGWSWLKRQLSVLSANTGSRREGFTDDPGFEISITAPEFEGGVRDIREDYINAGWGTLTAHINDEHQAVCELEALGIGKKTITSTTKFLSLKDIHLKVGVMVGLRAQMRNTDSASISNMQQILPIWGGVQVRYRNFRVFPYGDDDWLDIDKDRGIRRSQSRTNELSVFAGTLKGVEPAKSLLNMLSMRSYMGSVTIGEKASGFEMKLNREGFIQSDAVQELKQFVRFAIDWSTILRDFYIRQEATEKSIIAFKEFEELIQEKIEPVRYVEAAVTYLENEVRTITDILPQEQREDATRSFYKATEVIKKHNETNRAELLHLRLVASTSTLLLIFSHEVKSLLGLLEQSKNELKTLSVKLPLQERNNALAITERFTDLKSRLEDLLDMTSLVGAEQRRVKAGNVALKDKLKKIEKVFSLITKKYDVQIDFSQVPNNTIIKDVLEAEVYSVFLNIISNSIKSVIAGGYNKKIEIAAKRENGYNVVQVRDTGIGLHEDNFEEVFIPFISDPKGELYNSLEKHLNPEDKLIVGSGSGLGLGIVQEIVNAHNGTIKFTQPLKGWSAELEIKIP